MKRIIAIISAFMMLIGTTTSVMADPFNPSYYYDPNDFTDLSGGYWAYPYVYNLCLYNIHASPEVYIFRGYPDKTFKPNNPLTREEAASALSEYLGWEFGIYPVDTGFYQFKDMNPDRWSNWKVGKLASVNILKGYADGNFNPEGLVTRAEFMAMLYRTYNYLYPDLRTFSSFAPAQYNDISDGHWASHYIGSLVKHFVYTEDINWEYGKIDEGAYNGYFRPDEPITRLEASSIMCLFIYKNSRERKSSSGFPNGFDSNMRRYYDSLSPNIQELFKHKKTADSSPIVYGFNE